MRKPHVETYKDRKGEWRFRIRARNGKIIHAATEGYKRRRAVVHVLDLIAEALKNR